MLIALKVLSFIYLDTDYCELSVPLIVRLTSVKLLLGFCVVSCPQLPWHTCSPSETPVKVSLFCLYTVMAFTALHLPSRWGDWSMLPNLVQHSLVVAGESRRLTLTFTFWRNKLILGTELYWGMYWEITIIIGTELHSGQPTHTLVWPNNMLIVLSNLGKDFCLVHVWRMQVALAPALCAKIWLALASFIADKSSLFQKSPKLSPYCVWAYLLTLIYGQPCAIVSRAKSISTGTYINVSKFKVGTGD